MKAVVGDRMVVASSKLDGPVRDGEILTVGDAEGGGPYLVRWSDSGRETLFFPGPDAHIEHQQPAANGTETSEGPAERPRHTKEWHVDIYLYEDADATTASAVLRSDIAEPLKSRGEARRRPSDPDVPEIGDEVAVARALRRLADRLLGTAEGDIEALEGHPVHLRL